MNEHKLFKIIILSLSGFIILASSFGLGVIVGVKKAEFSFAWADQYHRNFGGPPQGFLGDYAAENFTAANGSFGEVIKIDSSTDLQYTNITVRSGDNIEKTILADDKTYVTVQRKKINLAEIKLGDNVVVIGQPNSNAQITAELIRIMPSPPPFFKK